MRTSLYSKIIPWFFISITVLAVLFSLLFKIDFRVDPGNWFQEEGGDRMLNLGWRLSSELSNAQENEREQVLARYANTYRMDFFIFDRDGIRLLGSSVDLPPDVEKIVSGLYIPQVGPHQDLPPLEHLPHHQSPVLAKPPQPEQVNPKFSITTENPTRYWVGVRVPCQLDDRPPQPVIVLARSDSMTGHGLFWDPLPWLIAIGLFVLLGVLMWIPIIRNITRPIGKMTRLTEAMAKGRFDVQLDVRRSDEIGRLGISINDMGKHLSGYLSNQRRFLADISHELISPIARAKLALSIAEPETEGKAQMRIRNALGELENMSDLVDKLLALTRTEVGASKIRLVPVNVKEAVKQAVELEKKEGADIQLVIESDLAVLADTYLLSRALANLIRNAIRYAGNDGSIIIDGQREGEAVVIEISDQGPGVPSVELEYIFEPFYRTEGSRSRKTGGVGLGLAVVKSCIEACKGTVSASNLQPKGFAVRIELRSCDQS